jgi:hypothetical protein
MSVSGQFGTDRGLDAVARKLSGLLAERVSRRSALEKVGRYGMAMSLGAAGVALAPGGLAEAAALASCCDTCVSNPCGGSGCPNSVWCGLGGVCPSGTCECGSWSIGGSCTSGGKSGTYYAGDCCGNCGGGTNCACHSGAVQCCNYHEWQNGWCAVNDCTCGTSGWFIKCRRQYCHTG